MRRKPCAERDGERDSLREADRRGARGGGGFNPPHTHRNCRAFGERETEIERERD